MALKESFNWIPPGMKSLPRENLLKLVAKTEAETLHPGEPYPVRRFSVKELELAARTLIDRPVGRNHESLIPDAQVLDSEYADKCVESVAYVPGDWAKKVRDGTIKNCSVEYTWRSEKVDESVTPHAVEFEGLVFTRVDLLEGLNPGDKNSKVMLFEAEKKTGSFISEVQVLESATEKFKRLHEEAEEAKKAKESAVPAAPAKSAKEIVAEPVSPTTQPPIIADKPVLGEPFAGYTDFADCVAKNQDKANPEAYCGSIKAQAESTKLATALTEIVTLKEAFTRIQTELTTIKSTQDKRIADAKTFAHNELKTAVESVLPRGGLFKNPAGTLLIKKLKEVLDEPIYTNH